MREELLAPAYGGIDLEIIMKLWLLSPKQEEGPWNPWYDKCFGFVIRAEDEASARALAHANAGDENRRGGSPWLDESQSSCEELLPDGEAGMILQDFHAA